jgi:hypothetical protein
MSVVAHGACVVPGANARSRVTERAVRKTQTRGAAVVSHAIAFDGRRGSLRRACKGFRTSQGKLGNGLLSAGDAEFKSPRVDHHRNAVVAKGLPIPIIGGLFNPAIMAILYVFVAIRFALNYNKTDFTEKNKAAMIGLWPMLAVTSASFRENLKKATMG